MTSYTGLYVLKTESGEIRKVQVEDTTGISLSLDPDEYERRGVLPAIKDLPDSDEYQK